MLDRCCYVSWGKIAIMAVSLWFIKNFWFLEETFLQCFRQAHHDVSRRLEITTVVEFIVHRMKSALYEDWTEGQVFLRKCVRNGSVKFCVLRSLLGEMNELWPSICQYVRFTGPPHVKENLIALVLLFLFH